jgi:hypothetical protein
LLIEIKELDLRPKPEYHEDPDDPPIEKSSSCF